MKKFHPSEETSAIMTKLVMGGAEIGAVVALVVALVVAAAKDGADLFADTLQERIKKIDDPTIDN